MTNRIAFQIGHFVTIYWYGVFVALGFIVGLFVMQWRARKSGFPPEKIFDIVFAAMVGGILGARIFYVLSNLKYFSRNPGEIIMIHHGGLVFYGGFIGATLLIWFLCKKHKYDPYLVADLAAFGVPTGQAFGRIGCFLNGCCFGSPSHSALAITYHEPPYQSVWQVQLEKGLITPDNIDSLSTGVNSYKCLPVTPTQAYQSLTNVAILVTLILVAPRIKHRGQLFGLFLMLYAIGRFLNEFNRGDYLELHAGMTIAQVICLFIFPAGVGLFIWCAKRRPVEATSA